MKQEQNDPHKAKKRQGKRSGRFRARFENKRRQAVSHIHICMRDARGTCHVTCEGRHEGTERAGA